MELPYRIEAGEEISLELLAKRLRCQGVDEMNILGIRTFKTHKQYAINGHQPLLYYVEHSEKLPETADELVGRGYSQIPFFQEREGMPTIAESAITVMWHAAQLVGLGYRMKPHQVFYQGLAIADTYVHALEESAVLAYVEEQTDRVYVMELPGFETEIASIKEKILATSHLS